MLQIDRKQKAFSRLAPRALADAGLLERYDIQRMIVQSADAFFAEMGELLKLIREEARPAEFVSDRIDLLAVDADGAGVVIELKRDSHKLHLLQAIAYAGMVAKWPMDRFIDEFAEATSKSRDEAITELEEFLEQGDVAAINQSQRVILLAEEFDYEVLVTAEWLYGQYEVDIRCYRLSLATSGDQEFLTCVRLYPPPELTDYAKRRGPGPQARGQFPDWNAALAIIENAALANFVRAELATNRESRPARASLRYRVNGKLRYRMWARKQFATVIQNGRFEGDEDYWKTRLSPDAQLRSRRQGSDLRFRLRTEEDFRNFKTAWDNDLQNKAFVTLPEEHPEVGDEERDIEE
jgi:hypothetical protein